MADRPTETTERALTGLRRRIAGMRVVGYAVMAAERLLLVALPGLAVVAVTLIFAWSGFFRILPLYPKLALIAVLVLGLGAALLRLRAFRWPDRREVDGRLERQSGLDHQAISVQADKPVSDDPVSRSLWKAHQARMAAKIGRITAGGPAPDVARRDPYALRAVLVLGLVVALSFSWSNFGGRLADLWTLPEESSAESTLRIDAWVTPPAYTSLAPVYLRATLPKDVIRVPQYSELSIRMSGGDNAGVRFTAQASGKTMAVLAEKDPQATAPSSATDPGRAQSYKLKLTDAGTVTIGDRAYRFELTPDHPPSIAFAKEPGRAVNGALEIAYAAKDDYGVVQARAEIRPLAAKADAIALFEPPSFPLDLPGGNAKDVKATASRDLTEHPLSGKVVELTLIARDAAGLEGRSEAKTIVLPTRFFSEALAGSIVEQRQVFSLDVNQIARALALNEAASLRPEEQIPELDNYLLLQSVRNRLQLARSLSDLEEAATYFWDVARYIEDGDLSSAEKRLRDAQQKLSDALNRNASDQEIAKLMDELRQAMKDYIAEMAKRMQNPDANRMASQNQRMMRSQDLENMLNQLENLARSGNKDEARKLLSEMQRMMNNMQTARPRNNQQQQQNPVREQIDKLGELMQKQQKLMEETHRLEQALRDRMQRGDPMDEDGLMPNEDPFGDMQQDESDQPQAEGEQGKDQPQDQAQQPEGKDGQPGQEQMSAEQLRQALKDLKAQQDRLGKDLEALQKGLSALGLKAPDGFKDAGKEMGESATALGKSQGQRSADAQGRALDALRKGAGDMMKQLQQQAGRNGQQGMPMPGGLQAEGNDPLGRRSGQLGGEMDDQVKVPDEVDVQRAREILDQIRRKLGEGPASLIEKEYLERLLDLR